MLLVKHPERADILGILQGLVDGDYSRPEVESWWRATENQFGPVDLAPHDGYWYYQSLAALCIPISLSDGEPYFIRARDIEEYLLDMKGVDSDQTFEGITRVRHHQIDSESIRWPLVMFEHTDINRLDHLGLHPVRGIFDPHLDLVEHTHLFFRGNLYLIVRQYDDQAHQVMVLGTNRNEDQLREFLSILGYV